MLEKFKKNVQFRNWFLLATYVILLAAVVFNYRTFYNEVMATIWVFKPFFYGLAFAFILNIPMTMIERQFEKRLKPSNFLYKKRRGISILLTIILFIVVISVLSMIIFPKIIESLVSVIQQASSLLGGLIRNIDGILSFFGFDYTLTSISELMQFVNLDWPSIFQKALDFLNSTTGGVVALLTSFGASIAWAFAGFMLSLYLLAQKETYILQFRKVMTVMLGTQRARRFFKVSSLANEIFKSFVGGQLIEACVQWALYWVLLTLMGFPFPELLSTIIAVFALVPVFGPTISMFLNGLLVLTVKSPLYVIWFFVVYQVIQQFDNNVIYPRIVGKQVGLPGIWVLLSIFVFGDLFGLIGMLVAVPTTAFLYALLTQFVSKSLKEKQVTVTLTSVLETSDATIIQP